MDVAEAKAALQTAKARRAELEAEITELRDRISVAETEARTAHAKLITLSPESANNFQKLIRAESDALATEKILREQLALKEAEFAGLPEIARLEHAVHRAELDLVRDRLRQDAETLSAMALQITAPLVEKFNAWRTECAAAMEQFLAFEGNRYEQLYHHFSPPMRFREIERAIGEYFSSLHPWSRDDLWTICGWLHEQQIRPQREAAERAAREARVATGTIPGTVEFFIKQQGGLPKNDPDVTLPPAIEQKPRKEMPY